MIFHTIHFDAQNSLSIDHEVSHIYNYNFFAYKKRKKLITSECVTNGSPCVRNTGSKYIYFCDFDEIPCCTLSQLCFEWFMNQRKHSHSIISLKHSQQIHNVKKNALKVIAQAICNGRQYRGNCALAQNWMVMARKKSFIHSSITIKWKRIPLYGILLKKSW